MEPSQSTENLEDLIRAIREEGVEQVSREREEILAAARTEASAIVKQAGTRADQLAGERRKQLEQQGDAARRALQQAARDLVLSVRTTLRDLCDRLIRHECGELLQREALERLILGVAQSWVRQAGDGAMELQLNETDRERLAATFVGRLQETLKSGVELKVHPDVRHGFRIGAEDGSMFYDFTDEGVAAALSELVSPQLADLFDEITHAAEERADG